MNNAANQEAIDMLRAVYLSLARNDQFVGANNIVLLSLFSFNIEFDNNQNETVLFKDGTATFSVKALTSKECFDLANDIINSIKSNDSNFYVASMIYSCFKKNNDIRNVAKYLSLSNVKKINDVKNGISVDCTEMSNYDSVIFCALICTELAEVLTQKTFQTSIGLRTECFNEAEENFLKAIGSTFMTIEPCINLICIRYYIGLGMMLEHRFHISVGICDVVQDIIDRANKFFK